MATVGENLISYVGGLLGGGWHVGETIPDEIARPTVVIRQAGETPGECLGDPAEVDAVAFDVEIAGDEIAAVREATATVKSGLRSLYNWPAELEGAAQYVAVDDHETDYVSQLPREPENVEVETLRVTVHF